VSLGAVRRQLLVPRCSRDVGSALRFRAHHTHDRVESPIVFHLQCQALSEFLIFRGQAHELLVDHLQRRYVLISIWQRVDDTRESRFVVLERRVGGHPAIEELVTNQPRCAM